MHGQQYSAMPLDSRRDDPLARGRSHSPKAVALAQAGELPTLPVVLAGFAAFLDLYAPQPLLPLLARTFGASTFEAGLTVTASTMAVAVFAPFIGRLADRLGLRRVIVGACNQLVEVIAQSTTEVADVESPLKTFWRPLGVRMQRELSPARMLACSDVNRLRA